MYGLNAFALIVFAAIHGLAALYRRQPESVRRRAMVLLCAAMLAENLLRYGIIYPLTRTEAVLPAEFSTVAYFVVPAVLLVRRSRWTSWAAYSGVMAGFFYYLTVIALGGFIYGAQPPLEIYLSMLNHAAVYFLGLVTMGERLFRPQAKGRILLGLLCVALNALALRAFVPDPGQVFIYMLLDGVVVRLICPAEYLALALTCYAGLVAVLLLLSVRGFFRWNRALFMRQASADLRGRARRRLPPSSRSALHGAY